jgi:hypothetical protein
MSRLIIIIIIIRDYFLKQDSFGNSLDLSNIKMYL